MTTTYSPIAAPVRSAIRSAFALEGGLKPAVDWNFAGGVMPSALTFSRASLATMYDAAGTLVWCPHNLLWPSSNLLHANWATGITQGVTREVGGYLETAVTDLHRVGYQLAGTTTALRTLRAKVKARGRRYVVVWSWSGGDTAGVAFDLQAGSVVSDPFAATGPAFIGAADPDGYRYIAATIAPLNTIAVVIMASDAADQNPFLGDVTKGLYIKSAEIVVGRQTFGVETTSAAYFGPRLTYDPVTHSALGLLVEEQRTNLLLNSRLDGTNLSTQSVTVAATQYTLSFYGTGQIVLSGSATATVVGTGAFPTQKTYTFTPSAGSLTLTVTGTVQFAQLEAGACATSYIPTDAASATRAADVVTCTGAAFSSWFSSTEGTFVVEGTAPPTVVGTAMLVDARAGSSTANQLTAYQVGSVPISTVTSGGVSQAVMVPSGTVVAGAAVRIAAAFKANDCAVSFNGSAVASDASVAMPIGVDNLCLGCSASVANWWNGQIKRVRYWPKRLTNAQLQALTA